MATVVVQIESENLSSGMDHLSVQDQGPMQSAGENREMGDKSHGGVCTICLDKIALQDTALVKGCEHAYCVTCILHWATYSRSPACPQCKHPFDFLNIHRSLDGSIHDYMFEESVCLLLRAPWFKPLVVEYPEEKHDEMEDFYLYEDDDELDEDYYNCSRGLCIGNRRWGDSGYVRAGRREARPAHRSNSHDPGASSSRDPKKTPVTNCSRDSKKTLGASSSREPKKKEAVESTTGRRAKRALKREAADKAAAAKHEQHLARLGRN